ncbi:MAG TPA: tetratricopeptide repeat protein, partial [Chthonomonadaceae bacterium]|nr:tetratricopeptide repeat protein [Chthonomonadaceae bacterium]
ENTEIRDLFTDREHCVLYGAEDLEALLDYYLTHDAEREQIADAGRWRVHPHDYARHLAGMLDTLEPMAAAKKAREGENAPRGLCLASPHEKRVRLASQWLCSTDRTIYPKLDALLTTAAEEATGAAERAEIANLHAALLGEWAHTVSSPPEQLEKVQAALAHAQRALEWEPDYLAARYNLGFLRFSAGQAEEAERTLCEVAESLAAPDVRPSQLRGVYFPRRFDYFDVEIERLWGESAPDTQAWCDGLRSILRWCIHATLTATAFARGEYETALFHAEQAVAQRPTLGETLHSMALALRALGRREEAANACRRAVADAPFLLPAWEDLVRIYLDLRRPEEALTVLEEAAVLLDGCPVYASARPGFESLRAQAQQQVRQQQTLLQATPLRLLAFPDWSEAARWQALVRAFAAQYGPEDPAVLLLRADPVLHPSAEALLERLAAFLIQEMGLPEEALPNITLLNESLQEGELGRLFGAADAVLTHDGMELTALHRELARTAGLPIWTLDEMASRKAA